jgi:hypothetical protein
MTNRKDDTGDSDGIYLIPIDHLAGVRVHDRDEAAAVQLQRANSFFDHLDLKGREGEDYPGVENSVENLLKEITPAGWDMLVVPLTNSPVMEL